MNTLKCTDQTAVIQCLANCAAWSDTIQRNAARYNSTKNIKKTEITSDKNSSNLHIQLWQRMHGYEPLEKACYWGDDSCIFPSPKTEATLVKRFQMELLVPILYQPPQPEM